MDVWLKTVLKLPQLSKYLGPWTTPGWLEPSGFSCLFWTQWTQYLLLRLNHFFPLCETFRTVAYRRSSIDWRSLSITAPLFSKVLGNDKSSANSQKVGSLAGESWSKYKPSLPGMFSLNRLILHCDGTCNLPGQVVKRVLTLGARISREIPESVAAAGLIEWWT